MTKKKYVYLTIFLVVCVVITFISLYGCGRSEGINGFGSPPEDEGFDSAEKAHEAAMLSKKVGNQFLERAEVLYNSGMSEQAAFQQAVDELKNNPDVVAVRYKSGSITIYNRLGGAFDILIDAGIRVGKYDWFFSRSIENLEQGN